MNRRVRWLILAVKSWASVCGLSSSSHFTTYALIWLVLFFLMHKKYVPPVSALMEKKEKLKIQGWPCSISQAPYICDFKDSCEKLLLDFFLFYSSFEFWKFMICTRSGTVVRKVFMSEVVKFKLPEQIRDYVDYVTRYTHAPRLNLTPCSVQDPFDLSHNITKQVKPSVLSQFQHFCDVASFQIQSWSSV